MTINHKEELAREWIKCLGEDDPGEGWTLEQEDMDLIKDALVFWLQQAKDYVPSIQVFIDGTPYEVK